MKTSGLPASPRKTWHWQEPPSSSISPPPAVIGKGTYRRDLVASQSARLMCGYLYACACCQESTQDLVYAGHNLIAENGIIFGRVGNHGSGFFWCRKSMCDI